MKINTLTSETNQLLEIRAGNRIYHRKYNKYWSVNIPTTELIEWFEIQGAGVYSMPVKIWNREKLQELEEKYQKELDLAI